MSAAVRSLASEGSNLNFIQSRTGQVLNLLEAGNVASAQDLAPDGALWRSASDQPQIVCAIESPQRRGAVVFDLDVEIQKGEPAPRLCFHGRTGFDPERSQPMRRTGAGHYRLYVFMRRPCKMVRLDFAGSQCVFRLNAFRMTQSRYGVFAARVLRGGADLGDVKPRFKRLLKAGWQAIRTGVAFETAGRDFADADHAPPYQRWIRARDYRPDGEPAIRKRLGKAATTPKISVLMPVYNTPRAILDAAIASVTGQIYQNWELCIANDASTADWIRPALDGWQARDARIKIVHRDCNGHIAEATNSAFGLATGDFIALLDHDDLLRPHALAEVALAIDGNPNAQLIYSDEDKIDNSGARSNPYFKPEWNPLLFLGQNYLNHLTVHRAGNIRRAGGWRSEFNGSQDYDLTLRVIETIDDRDIVHIPKILYHWRMDTGSMALDESSKSYAVVNAGRALQAHFDRMGITARAEKIPDLNWFRPRFSLPAKPPLVSLIIPTRNGHGILRSCIESIISKTTYKNYEIIIVDNGSDERETIDYLARLRKGKVAKVLSYPLAFNYSAINNFAVARAKGEFVGLVNNDIEVITPQWLDEMMALALLPGVGCVGAKLYYPNDTIQHAGVIVGIGGVAGHSHKYFDRRSTGYFGRLRMVQNVTAVTGACLVVRKSIFGEARGLDERNLKIAFNDVDFCLEVRKKGYMNVWTPFAELYHHESLTRGPENDPVKLARFASEVKHMQKKWAGALAVDRYYSPNLTRDYENFGINLDAGG